MRKTHLTVVLTLGLAATVLLAGCARPTPAAAPFEAQQGPTSAPTPIPAATYPPEPTATLTPEPTGTLIPLSGELTIADALGVGRITRTLADATMALYSDATIEVEPLGSYEALNIFCDGSVPLAASRRQIMGMLEERCQDNGIEWAQFPMALDAVVILVNASNAELTPVTCMTPSELGTILRADSEVMLWSDIRSGWPDTDMMLYLHGPDNGWSETLLLTLPGLADQTALRADPGAEPVVPGVLDLVANHLDGFTYYAFKDFNALRTPGVRAIAVENAAGECVEASDQAIQRGLYPLAHPLYLYANLDGLRSEPLIGGFIRHTLETAIHTAGPESGYVLLPGEEYQEALAELREMDGESQ